MAQWTHVICEECWNKKNPAREPVRIAPVIEENARFCCFCGSQTNAGIFIRHNPQELFCTHNEA